MMAVGSLKMPKKTKDEIYYWLWFEALRLSDEYREVCEWVENSLDPEEKLDWSQYPHIKETYLHMGDVFLLLLNSFKAFNELDDYKQFEAWWKQRAPFFKGIPKITAEMKIITLDIPEIVNEGLDLFKDEITRNFDKGKHLLNMWITEHHKQPEDLTIKIDTATFYNAKDALPVIKKRITKHRGKNRPKGKRFRPEDIGCYLNHYRASNGLRPILCKDWPGKQAYEKDIGSNRLEDSDSNRLEDSDKLRKIGKARKVIDNAINGRFLGV